MILYSSTHAKSHKLHSPAFPILSSSIIRLGGERKVIINNGCSLSLSLSLILHSIHTHSVLPHTFYIRDTQANPMLTRLGRLGFQRILIHSKPNIICPRSHEANRAFATQMLRLDDLRDNAGARRTVRRRRSSRIGIPRVYSRKPHS